MLSFGGVQFGTRKGTSRDRRDGSPFRASGSSCAQESRLPALMKLAREHNALYLLQVFRLFARARAFALGLGEFTPKQSLRFLNWIEVAWPDHPLARMMRTLRLVPCHECPKDLLARWTPEALALVFSMDWYSAEGRGACVLPAACMAASAGGALQLPELPRDLRLAIDAWGLFWTPWLDKRSPLRAPCRAMVVDWARSHGASGVQARRIAEIIRPPRAPKGSTSTTLDEWMQAVWRDPLARSPRMLRPKRSRWSSKDVRAGVVLEALASVRSAEGRMTQCLAASVPPAAQVGAARLGRTLPPQMPANLQLAVHAWEWFWTPWMQKRQPDAAPYRAIVEAWACGQGASTAQARSIARLIRPPEAATGRRSVAQT